MKLRQTSPDVWRCEYISTITGLHSVNVFFAGKLIPKSPMGVKIAPVFDAKKCRAYGRGLLPDGVRLKDIADFVVITKDAGEAVPEIRCRGPDGVALPVTYVQSENISRKIFFFSFRIIKLIFFSLLSG